MIKASRNVPSGLVARRPSLVRSTAISTFWVVGGSSKRLIHTFSLDIGSRNSMVTVPVAIAVESAPSTPVWVVMLNATSGLNINAERSFCENVISSNAA
jgi:hypothetical protein